MKIIGAVLICVFSLSSLATQSHAESTEQSLFQLGPRPLYLIDRMKDGPLKTQLKSCQNKAIEKTDFSIGHRGAGLQFPEHTKESYVAAANMGAGIVECDVTFTKDKELVCRHSQCDLQTTTNILAVPELAAKCSEGFSPYDPVTGAPASAKCCTSDITLAEFKSLCGKMDGANEKAETVGDYINGTSTYRTDLYAQCGTVLSHKESIELFKSLDVKMTPELKEASVPMPYQGDYSQEQYAQQMINDYKTAGVSPNQVFPQSFNLKDVLYWINNEPEFGAQAVYLDGRYDDPNFDFRLSDTWSPTMAELKAQGVNYLAPPMWMLLDLASDRSIKASYYSEEAKKSGLKLITWTLERSGLMTDGGGWYYQSTEEAISSDGDIYRTLDVLAKEVGIVGIFSDWPATVTYYANCMDTE